MTAPDTIVSASRFYFSSATTGNNIPIIEMKSINSQVEASEYIYNDAKGNTVHTKQFGKTKPPTVSFVAGLEPTACQKMFAWHEEARLGKPSAKADVSLYLIDAGNTFKITYLLRQAWVAKLEVSGAKAGATENITVTITLECDHIECNS